MSFLLDLLTALVFWAFAFGLAFLVVLTIGAAFFYLTDRRD